VASRSLGVLTLDLVLKLGGFTQGMDRAARETQRSMARIESSIKSAQRGFALFTRGLGAIGVGFGLSSIVRGFADATKEAIEFGDEIGKAMAKTGLGAEAMSELAAVAKASEVELDTLTTALRNMQVVISDAAAGNKAAALVLKDLGLTFRELQALKPDQQFELIAQRISEFGSEADRAALRQDVFKRAAEGLAPIMERGAEGIREMREEFRRLGVTLSEEQVAAFKKADDAIDKATLAYDSLKRSIGGVLAEPLAEFFNGVAEAIGNATNESLSFGDKVGFILKAYKQAFADKGILAGPQDLAEAYAKITEEANKAAAATKQFGAPSRAALLAGSRHRTTRDGDEPKGASEAERARKAILDLITSMEQQVAVTGETEEATIKYRIAFGDLVDDFKKAGPSFEKRKQELIDAARAADQFKAGEELNKANEQIAEQVIELQAARIALDQGAAAAFEYSAQHGELAKTLDLATDSQADYNAEVEKGAQARADLEREQAVTAADALVRSTEEATAAIQANAIAEEQGAVAAIRYRIAHGDLKVMFEDLGPAAAEWQAALEKAAAAQEAITQRQAEDAASEAIIPSRTKALEEYNNALAGLERRLAAAEISQKDFDKAVEIARENFEDATRAIDDMSVFAEQAARNMQDAFADFLFDPFEDRLEGMVNSFPDTLRRMAAEIVAAQLAEKFNFEDLFKGFSLGDIFGGGGGGTFGSGPVPGVPGAISLTSSLAGFDPRQVALPDLAGGGAAAATTATALTTAGTAAATAFTAAGTTAATALTAAGTTVAGAITAAGTSAAAAISAAGAAGGAAGGMSTLISGFDFSGIGFERGGYVAPGQVALVGESSSGRANPEVLLGGRVNARDQAAIVAAVPALSMARPPTPGRPVLVGESPDGRERPQFVFGGPTGITVIPLKELQRERTLERLLDRGPFAGYFATGGYIPPNRFGVVGDSMSGRAASELLLAGNVAGGPSAGQGKTVVNQSITVNAPSGSVSRATEMQLTAAAARGARAADRHNN
jgi:hypothetical protein